MIISSLKQIGLNEKQAKIYLACLELGETSIKEIAKKSEIKRTTIYDVIDEMIQSGYIKTTTRGKKVKFIAINPSELNKLIKKREEILNQILPNLDMISNVEKTKPKIWFYQETEGIKHVYEDLLNYENIDVYGWGSEESTILLGDEWCNKYVSRRTRKKIKLNIIYPLTKITELYKKNDKSQHRVSKTINPKKYIFSIEINIYGNRIAMISAKDKIGVIMESKPIASTMKMIFNLCWDNL